MDSDNLNVPTDGDAGHMAADAGRERHELDGQHRQPAQSQTDGTTDGDTRDDAGAPEFFDDPGSGFGFADADELGAMQHACERMFDDPSFQHGDELVLLALQAIRVACVFGEYAKIELRDESVLPIAVLPVWRDDAASVQFGRDA